MANEILDMAGDPILDMSGEAILDMGAPDAGISAYAILDMAGDPILDMAGDPILDMSAPDAGTVWPSGVPFFIAHGNLSRTGPQGAVLRTAMDHGPSKTRRRFTAAPRGFVGSTPFLTKAQLAAFEAFFEVDLQMGAVSFLATDPMGCEQKRFRFVGTYNIVPVGRSFRVSANLEILP